MINWTEGANKIDYSWYDKENKLVCIPLSILTGQEYTRLRDECFGTTYGGAYNKILTIPSAFWHEGYEYLMHRSPKHKALRGFNDLLLVGAQEPGAGWEHCRPHLSDYKLEGGESHSLRPYQAQAVSAMVDSNLLLADDMGLGKALWNDTKVSTPEGMIPIHRLRVGDTITCPTTGKIQYVIGVYPQGVKECYKITFSDDTTCYACDEHLWKITSQNDLVKTSQLRIGDKIPNTNVLDIWPEQQLQIDPYLLGVYLGDGHGCNYVTTSDMQMIESLLPAVLPDGMWMEHSDRYTYKFQSSVSPSPFMKGIRWLGLEGKRAWEKFVPDKYKFNTPENRLAILQGILDTDSYIRPGSNTVILTTTSPALVNDVMWIVRSLGGYTKLTLRNKTKHRQAYDVAINLRDGISPFRLQRRLENYKIKFEINKKKVVSIVKQINVDMTCIKVSNPSGLFLIEDFIVTHNTVSALTTRKELIKEHSRCWRTLVIVPSLEVARAWINMSLKYFNEPAIHIDERDWFTKESKYKFLQLFGIWIVMYSKIRIEDYKEFLMNHMDKNYTLVIPDEVHCCANYTSKQHQALDEILNKAYRTILMTGTEFTHSPGTYHAIYKLATRTTIPLENWTSYFNRGLVDKNTGKPRWCEERLRSLKAIRGTYALRREKSDVANLPPQTGPIMITVPMTIDHRKAYIQLWNESKYEFINELGMLTEETIQHFLGKFIRLYQICTLPLLLKSPIIPTYKLEALFNLLEGCGDQKVIIWCNFPGCIEWLTEKIRERMYWKRVGYAHGKVSQKERDALIHSFEVKKEIDYVIANPAIWGQGITLNEASITIYWDLHPSRARWVQSQDRNYRIGQTKPTTIYGLLHENSIEGMTYNWLCQKDYWSDLVMYGESDKKKHKIKTHSNTKYKLGE